MQRFRPEAIVCQCGADALANDPLGTFNLTPAAYARCITVIQGYQLPTLYLGGGGYHKANASRCFTRILASLIGVQLASDIPEHEVYKSSISNYNLGLLFRDDCYLFIMTSVFRLVRAEFRVGYQQRPEARRKQSRLYPEPFRASVG